MWRVVLLAFCYHVVSQAQPATDEPSPRHIRELIECCPCPKGSDTLGSQSRLEDDCPCRGRSADSEGASSVLFPATSGAGRRLNSVPFIRSNTPKDDVKNLLEPEVGLATSMLETLREATEEEYQDALARDAARDAVSEESRNVVIIVKPRNNDDIVSEASNVNENRCIHPLGRASTVSQPFRSLPNVLGHPKARKPSVMHLWDRDSNVGASDVQESIVDKNDDGTPRSLFRFATPLRDAQKSSPIIQNPTVLETLKSRPNIFERLNLPLLPKMKVDTPLRKANNINTDISPPNIVQEEIENVPKGNGLSQFNNRSLMLKNLLNLSDVELIPQTTPIRPIFKTKLLNNELSSNRDTHDDDSTYDSKMNEMVLMPPINQDKEYFNEKIEGSESFKNNIQVNEENIQDAFTSPSESVPAIVSIPQTVMSDKLDCSDLSSEEIIGTTTESLSKVLQADSELSEGLDPTQLFEIQEVTNNEEESSISHEAPESTYIANAESDMNTNNIENVVPFNDIDNEETVLLPESNQDIGDPVDKVDEALSNDEFPEHHIKNKETSPLLNEKDNIIPKIKTIPPITETLSTIRDNVRKTLETLKYKSLNSGPVKKEKNRSAALTHILDQEPKTEKTSNNVDTSAKDQKKALQQVTFQDLQKLSNDILILSSNNEESTTSKEEEEGQEVTEQSKEEQEPTNNTDLDLQDEATSISDVGVPKYANAELTEGQEVTEQSSEEQEPTNNTDLNLQDEATSILDVGVPKFVNAELAEKSSNDILILRSNNEESTTTKEEEDGQEVREQSSEEQEPINNTDSDLQDDANSISDVGVPKYANVELAEENSCIFSDENKTIKSTKQSKSAVQDVNLNDMLSEASAPSPSILPALLDPLNLNDQRKSSLFQNLNALDPLNLKKNMGSIHLEPLNIGDKFRSPILPDLDPLNLNEKLESPLLPILDPLNVGAALQDIIVPLTIQDDPLNLLAKPITEVLKLPTLEDLREGLASVFDTNAKSTEHNLSYEDGDCKDDVPEMASAASNNNFRVPSKKPLEDLNVDIFQLNPLSSSQKDILSKVPRLNLNNFRTKLPIPTNLELKPVKLESRVGNNKGNILGASLTFGDKIASRKAMPQSKLLRQPLGNLPSFDELRNTLHSGAHSLLGSYKPNLDLFRNSHFPSSGLPDIDEIRRNAEKTFKSLQQRMRSSLNVGGLNNPLNDKLANPQDLLEDVNDKIKAIHYDLNDRLSSIHEDFLDKSRLKTLAIPIHTPTLSTGRSNNKELNTLRKIKAKPSRLQTSASTISSQETDPFVNGNENSVLRSPTRKSLKRLNINPQSGLVGAESSLVPTKLEPPMPRSTIDFPKKLLLTPLSQRLPTIRQGSDFKGKPLTVLKQPSLKDVKTPFLRKPSPFKDKTSKVTITFATTTPAPVTSPLESSTPSIKTTKPSVQSSKGESLKARLPLPRHKTLSDAKPLSSESKPLKISTPVKSKNNFKSANSHKDFPHLQNTDPVLSAKPRILNHKGLRDDRLRFNENNADRLKSATTKNYEPEIKNVKPIIKPLVWPKSGEDSFLAKVREAMQARLASFDPKKSAKVNIEKVDTEKMGNPMLSHVDMLKSASENNKVLVEAPLKESVPYKCRMMCTRE